MKWLNSSRQPEAAVVTCCHAVGEDSLGSYQRRHHYQIIQEVVYLDSTEDDVLWAKQHDKSDTDFHKEGDEMYDDIWTDITDHLLDVQWREWWWWILGFE